MLQIWYQSLIIKTNNGILIIYYYKKLDFYIKMKLKVLKTYL